MKKLLAWSLLCLGHLFANETSSIDKAHTNISITAESFLSGIDEYFADFLDDTSASNQEENSQEKINPKTIDELFQNEKYINETQKSFLLFSNDYIYNSLDKNGFNSALRGKIALNKSSRQLKLFFNRFDQKNINSPTKNKSEIGLSYLDEIKDDMDIRYFLGLRSLNPYVSARISYNHKTASWLIIPEQYIEYSIKDEFREKTTIYLDKNIFENILLRLQLQRSTRSDEKGMAYNGSFGLFWTPHSNTGLNFLQSFFGNTHYKTEENKYFQGVNDYQTKLTFRQNVLRKWFFYEISPAINFAKKNNFEANYSLFLKFDIFFGVDKYTSN